MAHARNLPLDGGAPALLHAYGAYGQALLPEFDVGRLSLLERGWVVRSMLVARACGFTIHKAQCMSLLVWLPDWLHLTS